MQDVGAFETLRRFERRRVGRGDLIVPGMQMLDLVRDPLPPCNGRRPAISSSMNTPI